MITTQIDYRNLQFLLYQDNKPVENPLPAEVQRVVIKQIIKDECEKLYETMGFRVSWEEARDILIRAQDLESGIDQQPDRMPTVH